MSGIVDGIKWFFENFGKPPEVEKPPLIPARLRIPVFVGMIVVSLVLLVLLLWLVVVPAIRSQQHGPTVSSPTGKSADVCFAVTPASGWNAVFNGGASLDGKARFVRGPAYA